MSGPRAGPRARVGFVRLCETGSLFSAVMQRATRTKLQIGQRYAQIEIPATVWQVVSVYRDAQGVEHAALASESRAPDRKTLSVVALQDRARYRLV